MSTWDDPVTALLGGDENDETGSDASDETPAFDVDALAADYRDTDPVVRFGTWAAYTDDERAALADARVPDPFAMFGEEYRAADGASRLQWWTQLTDDQRAELTARYSFTGPLSAMASDRFVAVTPDDPRYRSDTQVAKARVTAALAHVRRGDREWSDEFRAEVESLMAEAESLPLDHPDHGHAVQLAAHLVAQAEFEFDAAVPFGEPVRTKTYFGRDRKWHTREENSSGRVRETVSDMDLDPTQPGALVAARQQFDPPAPWEGRDVNTLGLDDVAGWSTADLVRLKNEHSQVFENLKDQESRQRESRRIGA